MTRLEKLINKKDFCETQAREAKNVGLKTFWTNASKGFEKQMYELTIEEAQEEV